LTPGENTDEKRANEQIVLVYSGFVQGHDLGRLVPERFEEFLAFRKPRKNRRVLGNPGTVWPGGHERNGTLRSDEIDVLGAPTSGVPIEEVLDRRRDGVHGGPFA
jgi:hypothetical protein